MPREPEQKWTENVRNEITAISVDTIRQCLWLGSWTKNLLEYNYNTHKVSTHLPQEGSINNEYSLLEIDSTQLLIGSWGSGLWMFNKDDKSFTPIHINAQSNSKISFLCNDILDLYQDKQKNIWIGTNGDGIIMQKRQQNIIQHQLIGQDNKSQGVSQVIQDANGTYILAAENIGIAFSNDFKTFRWAELTQDKKGSRINCFFPLSANKILFSSNDKIIKIIERKENTYRINQINISKKDDLFLKRLTSVVKDNNLNNYWIGTQQNGLILSNIDIISDKISIVERFHSKHIEKRYRISDNRISSLIIADSVLWIGTYGGLDYYDYKRDSIVQFSNKDIVGALSEKIILSLTTDKNGNIWCGTPSGLNKIYHDQGLWRIKYYGTEEGLPNVYITGVIHDANNMLWVSTNKGLAVYHPEADIFNAYIKGQMSGRLRFYENSLTINQNGEAVFGGIDGIAICKDDFTTSSKDYGNDSLYISSIKLSGKELLGRVEIDNKKHNIPSVNAIDTLNSSHKCNFIIKQ